jgi:hypothetical protein
LPICCLAILFKNRILRHEQINGRDNLVVESRPKFNPGTASPHDRTALDWKETTWIDVNDLIPTRYQVELLKDKNWLLKGSRDRRDYIRMDYKSDPNAPPTCTVWLFQSGADHAVLKGSDGILVIDSDDTAYNYKKFIGDIHMVPNSVQEIPHQNPSPGP